MNELVDGLRAAAEKGEAIFGNIDTWEIWNLTGGPNGGAHVTDVSNASRTMPLIQRGYAGEALGDVRPAA